MKTHFASTYSRNILGQSRKIKSNYVFSPSNYRVGILCSPFVANKNIKCLCTYRHVTVRAGSIAQSISTPLTHVYRALSSTPIYCSSRHFSSTRSDSPFKLDALPFTVSPDEALNKFYLWSDKEQGIKLVQRSIYISAVYVPIWSFDLNIRFRTEQNSRKRYHVKPEPFTIYDHDVVHVPGISSYAGYNYRRSLVDPVHNTTLVFMGDKTQLFGSWMLRNMTLSNGQTLSVDADPWNATKGRALEVVLGQMQELANKNADKIGPCTVETEVVKARRVYMPTYVISYSVLGVEYQAFVSGCDSAGSVSGASHVVWSSPPITVPSNFLQGTAQLVQHVGGPIGLLWLGQTILSLLLRVLTRFPLFAALGGAFVAFRKFIQPWYMDRSASMEWERQRDHEARMSDTAWTRSDDFFDNGSARQYFERNKQKILSRLSGEYEHTQGDFDWYTQWEEWARRQFEQQQRAQRQWYEDPGGGYQERQRSQRTQYQRKESASQRQQTQQKAKKDYKWDLDPNDPYSVLGIKRGASKSEVSQAFRREMLKYHPDTQTFSSDAEKEKCTERSKLITEAYRKIKNSMK